MSTHHVVIEVDEAYAERFPHADAEYRWSIECSDPQGCKGWIECNEDHDGCDPDDEDSVMFDRHDDEVEIHGQTHEWHGMHGWVLDHPGCPVQGYGADLPDGLHPMQPGRWEVEEEWDDTDLYLELITPREDGLY